MARHYSRTVMSVLIDLQAYGYAYVPVLIDSLALGSQLEQTMGK